MAVVADRKPDDDSDSEGDQAVSECITVTVVSSVISALIGVVIGALIGHWFAMNRDKRKEFNEVADRMRSPFEKQASEPSANRQVMTEDAGLLRHHLNWWQRKKYDQCIENYRAVTGESNYTSDSVGGVSYTDPEVVAQATRAILKFLRRR